MLNITICIGPIHLKSPSQTQTSTNPKCKIQKQHHNHHLKFMSVFGLTFPIKSTTYQINQSPVGFYYYNRVVFGELHIHQCKSWDDWILVLVLMESMSSYLGDCTRMHIQSDAATNHHVLSETDSGMYNLCSFTTEWTCFSV